MTGEEPDDDDLAEAPGGEQAAENTSAPGAIRALTRGLSVLEALNRQANASVTEIANTTGLARTTAYRVLETLCAAGLAMRTPEERYSLLAGVHRLADGFDGEPWIARLAKPAVAVLAKDFAWPLWLATLHGAELKAHPLSDAPALPGRLPLTGSAAGLAYLAALPAAQCAALLDVARLVETVSENILETLAAVSARGSARTDHEAEISLAVPVRLGPGVIASLAATLPRAALTTDQTPQPDQALDRITALLNHAAMEIAAAFVPKT